jgi:hypothetical protein
MFANLEERKTAVRRVIATKRCNLLGDIFNAFSLLRANKRQAHYPELAHLCHEGLLTRVAVRHEAVCSLRWIQVFDHVDLDLPGIFAQSRGIAKCSEQQQHDNRPRPRIQALCRLIGIHLSLLSLCHAHHNNRPPLSRRSPLVSVLHWRRSKYLRTYMRAKNNAWRQAMETRHH